MHSRAIFRENLPDGGRGSACAHKKRGGHTIALTAVAFDTSCDHIGSFICAALTYWYHVIYCVGFLAAVMASVVIAFQYFFTDSLIVGRVIALTQCQPLVSK